MYSPSRAGRRSAHGIGGAPRRRSPRFRRRAGSAVAIRTRAGCAFACSPRNSVWWTGRHRGPGAICRGAGRRWLWCVDCVSDQPDAVAGAHLLGLVTGLALPGTHPNPRRWPISPPPPGHLRRMVRPARPVLQPLQPIGLIAAEPAEVALPADPVVEAGRGHTEADFFHMAQTASRRWARRSNSRSVTHDLLGFGRPRLSTTAVSSDPTATQLASRGRHRVDERRVVNPK